MLRIVIEGEEVYNESTKKFGRVGDVKFDIEHSLVSLSKWESIHKKPFLSMESITPSEIISYVGCMVMTPDFDMKLLNQLTQKKIEQIQEYMESTESATTFGKLPDHSGPSETITSELIYFWMFSFHIPKECEYWHLNRLLALIRIFNIKNSPQKKRSAREIREERARLNEQRRAQYGTRG